LYKPDPKGSDKAILIFLFFSFKNNPVPDKVPPVPTAQVKASILPSVCSHISGPVVS